MSLALFPHVLWREKMIQKIPISLFETVKDQRATVQVDLDFEEISEFLLNSVAYTYSSKSDAPLLTSCEFQEARRLKANVLRSGLVILDVDDGMQIEQAAERVSEAGVAAFIYTTASHSAHKHKFRVGLPLAKNVDPETYRSVWAVWNSIFEGVADPSKRGSESLFYLPGTYPSGRGQFMQFSGSIITAEEIIAAVNLGSERKEPIGKPKSNNRTPVRRKSVPTEQVVDDIELLEQRSVYDSTLVSERAINAYLDTSENWYHARFRFMCSVAATASRRRVPISAAYLRDLFNQIDQIDGGYYTSSECQRALLEDAGRAIENYNK